MDTLQKNSLTFYFPREQYRFSIAEPSIITIGRSDGNCPLPMIDLAPFSGQLWGVSRQHGVIKYQDGAYWFMDCNSLWGTYINQTRIKAHWEYELKPGDMLSLGYFLMSVHFTLRARSAQRLARRAEALSVSV